MPPAGIELYEDLRHVLGQKMEPNSYGKAIEKFYLTLHCPALGDHREAGLNVGRLDLKNKAFSSDLYFDKSFGRLTIAKQRAFVRH